MLQRFFLWGACLVGGLLWITSPVWAEEKAPSAEPAPAEASPPPAEASTPPAADPKDETPPAAPQEEAPPSAEASTPTITSSSAVYEASYRQGTAPMKEKSKVRITRSGDGFEFTASKEPPWRIPVKHLRGVQTVEKGLWLYWFDDAGMTQQGFFEMSKDASLLAAEINQAIQDAQTDPFEVYKERYEEYKNKALKQSK